ncbi:MAG: ABC transporter substrate-binding protein [Alphaproteobacteria bacterium]|nr:MAG: ABC transporter substrate-binding protein [Alphaproteobacteria bacterium]
MSRVLYLALLLILPLFTGAARAEPPRHALAMHGAPKYAQNFTHFDYANPDAPKGGELRLGIIGSFDSLNPFILQGVAPAGLDHVYQRLMSRSRDEPFTLYGNLAETYEMPEDRRSIIFNIDPRARFSDGKPVTAEDVFFSYQLLREKGRPNARSYYRKVRKAEILGPLRIRFEFEEDGHWEMPLIMGLMTVLPRHDIDPDTFDKSTLTPFVGSGPYMIEKVEPGRRIIYKRNPDFWGRDLPVNRGRFNFNRVIYDYFRDDDIAMEAFKAHSLDARFESEAGKWKNAYFGPNGAKAPWVKTEPKLGLPTPMLGLVFNTRREEFRDIDVRKALSYAFDFEWLNDKILHGLYKRSTSFFENSPLAGNGKITAAEKKLLQPFRDELPKALFTESFVLPKSDGSGRNRTNLRIARKLLRDAGWHYRDGALRNDRTGAPFKIEFLVNNSEYVRLITPYQKNLEILGIETAIRLMDSAGYQNRLNNYDFDMIVNEWGQSLSPGNEQFFYWSRAAAKTPGTRNYPGIDLAVVDQLISDIISARTREGLVTTAQALDRVLLFQHYVIPLYYTDRQWLALWPDIKIPEHPSLWGTRPDLWWYSAAK